MAEETGTGDPINGRVAADMIIGVAIPEFERKGVHLDESRFIRQDEMIHSRHAGYKPISLIEHRFDEPEPYW